MTKIFITIDGETREANEQEAQEIVSFQAGCKAEADAAKATLAAKKQEVLAKLGLTADEVTALLA